MGQHWREFISGAGDGARLCNVMFFMSFSWPAPCHIVLYLGYYDREDTPLIYIFISEKNCPLRLYNSRTGVKKNNDYKAIRMRFLVLGCLRMLQILINSMQQ